MLIQQAKARGQVTLIVASRSATSSVSKQLQNHSSGSDVSRDRSHHPAECVVLREKKSKGMTNAPSWLTHLRVKNNILLAHLRVKIST